MIDLIAAASIAFLFMMLMCRLWNGISGMHEEALGRLQAVSDASILVSSFREQTAGTAGPPVFPAVLPSCRHGITGIRQSIIDRNPEKKRYILHFKLLERECTVLAEESE